MNLLRIASRVASIRTAEGHPNGRSLPGWKYGFYAVPLDESKPDSVFFSFRDADNDDAAWDRGQKLTEDVAGAAGIALEQFGGEFFAMSGGDGKSVARYIEVACPAEAVPQAEAAFEQMMRSQFSDLAGGTWEWMDKYPYWNGQ